MSWLDCQVEQCMDSGDRSVYLAGITDGALLNRASVLTVATLLRDAPPERKTALDQLYAQDQVIDRAAILAWRRSRQGL